MNGAVRLVRCTMDWVAQVQSKVNAPGVDEREIIAMNPAFKQTKGRGAEASTDKRDWGSHIADYINRILFYLRF